MIRPTAKLQIAVVVVVECSIYHELPRLTVYCCQLGPQNWHWNSGYLSPKLVFGALIHNWLRQRWWQWWIPLCRYCSSCFYRWWYGGMCSERVRSICVSEAQDGVHCFPTSGICNRSSMILWRKSRIAPRNSTCDQAVERNHLFKPHSQTSLSKSIIILPILHRQLSSYCSIRIKNVIWMGDNKFSRNLPIDRFEAHPDNAPWPDCSTFAINL